MKVTQVSVNGGASAVSVGATIPAKYACIVEDSGNPSEVLMVQLRNPNGTFSPEVAFPPGVLAVVWRSDGIVARPAGYSAANVPSSAEAYMKVRTFSGNTVNVRLTEMETLPPTPAQGAIL